MLGFLFTNYFHWRIKLTPGTVILSILMAVIINITSVEIVQVVCAYKLVENGQFVGPAYHFFNEGLTKNTVIDPVVRLDFMSFKRFL
jgi:hypothetical protein